MSRILSIVAVVLLSGCWLRKASVRGDFGAVSPATDEVVLVAGPDGTFAIDLRTRKGWRALPQGFYLAHASEPGDVLLLRMVDGPLWIADLGMERLRRVPVANRSADVRVALDGSRLFVLPERAGVWHALDSTTLEPADPPSCEELKHVEENNPLPSRCGNGRAREEKVCVAGASRVSVLMSRDSIRIGSAEGTATIATIVRPRTSLWRGTQCFFGRPSVFTDDCGTLIFEELGAVWLADVRTGRLHRLASGALVAVFPRAAFPPPDAAGARRSRDDYPGASSSNDHR